MTDTELIELYRQRSEQAIEETERRYGSYCRAIARGILELPEDVEECVSDAYFAIWRAIPPAAPQNFKAWLAAVVRNTALTRRRKNRRRPDLTPLSELADDLPCGSGPLRDQEALALADAVSAFLRSQPRDQRVAFLRRYWYQDSVQEVARRMGWTTGKTKSTLFRLRNKLRDALIKEELWHE